MQPMTKEQARAFVDRWQIIERHLIEEIRNVSPDLKAKQISAAYQAGMAMNLATEELPFAQWQRLREKLDGR